MTVAAIVPAAGRGERLSAGAPKALVRVGASTLIEHAVAGLRAAGVEDIVVVSPADLVDDVARLLPQTQVVAGGASRQESVRLGIAALRPEVDVVLVHDAARAFVPVAVVRRVLDALAAGAEAVIPVLPIADTVKQVDAANVVVATVDRSALRAVQTPQGFRRDVIERAHGAATGAIAAAATDDACLAEAIGVTVVTVAGSSEGFKVTTPFDLAVADAVLLRAGARV